MEKSIDENKTVNVRDDKARTKGFLNVWYKYIQSNLNINIINEKIANTNRETKYLQRIRWKF